MKIVTINGSARKGSYTGKALALVHAELKSLEGVSVSVIEPAQLKLAIPGSGMDASGAGEMQDLVREADGVVLATPEYHGSFSSLMKLVLENMGHPSQLKGKTISLLGVAAGRIGAVKSLEHLRSVCGHIGALVVPRVISVAEVRTVFDKQGNCLDPAVDREIRGLGLDLVKFIHEMRCPEISFEEMVRKNRLEKVGY